jgi:hypothetical protein
MSTVNELTLSPAGTEAEAGADPDDEDDDAGVDEDDAVGEDDDEQPAAIRAATAATATQPNRGMGLYFLSSSIQYTFRRNVRGYADVGHHRTHVSSAMKGRRCGD